MFVEKKKYYKVICINWIGEGNKDLYVNDEENFYMEIKFFMWFCVY